MFPDGIGAAQLAFEQLKAKLEAEGLFAPENKKPLPAYPQRIGLVTSRTGAALQDIRNVINRRWPAVQLVLCAVNVQGFEAAQEIAKAIELLDKRGNVDEIIVARGGGSKEDLWVFNAEVIARAAYKCKTPLISAIGHEIDFTILDFVADCRAPTPSAAAELAVPDREELGRKLCIIKENIHNTMQMCMEICYNRYNTGSVALAAGLPQGVLERNKAALAQTAQAITASAKAAHRNSALRLSHAAALAGTLNPYQVLARGYVMLEDAEGTLQTVEQLHPGQEITLCGARYRAECTVTAVEEKDESTKDL